MYNETEQKCCNKDNVCCFLDNGSYNCTRNGTFCGNICLQDAHSCDVGDCYNPGCSDGWSFGYISQRNVWGCIKGDISCYFDGDIKCLYKNSTLCGMDCTYDGICQLPEMEICADIDAETGLKKCPFHKAITETCSCPTNRNGKVGTICCPEGHIIINNACTLINCPEGQTPDENGICKTACENNAEVLDCVCPGTIYTNIFNAKICCESGYTWNENTQTCQ